MRINPWLLAVTLAVSLAARADTVTLSSGKVIEEVETKEEGDNIRVTKSDGSSMTYPKSMIASIEKKPTAVQEFSERKKALPPNDARARVALAKWCEERKLAKEARALYEEALSIDPSCADARKRLAEIAAAEQKEQEAKEQAKEHPAKTAEEELAEKCRQFADKLCEAWKNDDSWVKEFSRDAVTWTKDPILKTVERPCAIVRSYEFLSTLPNKDARYEFLRAQRRVASVGAQYGGEARDALIGLRKATDGDAKEIAKYAPEVYLGVRYRIENADHKQVDFDLIFARGTQGTSRYEWKYIALWGDTLADDDPTRRKGEK